MSDPSDSRAADVAPETPVRQVGRAGDLRLAPPGLVAVLDAYAIPLRLGAPRPGSGRLVLGVPRHDRLHAALAEALGPVPALAASIFTLPDGEQAFRLWDIGRFAAEAFWTAATLADPRASLSRATDDGEGALLELTCRKRGLAFLALPETATPAEPERLTPRAAVRLRAARFDLPDGTATVVGPPADGEAAFLDALRAAPLTAFAVRVTTRRRLEAALRHAVAASALAETVGRVGRLAPSLGAETCPSRLQILAILLAVSTMAVGLAGPAPDLRLALFAVFATVFTAASAVRLDAWLGADRGPPPAPADADADAELPSYSILVALYREAPMIGQLVRALDRLDYPRGRREIILLVEAGDAETRAACEAACQGRPDFRTVAVPPGAPRTKPRALAYGLAFAVGELVTVYDAEDRPDPRQLRTAAAALVRGPDHLACVQARLEIDRAVLPLQRQFAVEYAALFDGLLPYLGRNRLPLPLGGTSNHFKRRALDVCGGWDPYNVTEDADLGIRLARFGYSCDVIDSATYEEAPARIRVWIRQRVRWMKGWLVTWLVHMRHPRQLLREVGPRGFVVLQMHVAANVFGALLHPVGLVLVGLHVTGRLPLPPADTLPGAILLMLAFAAVGGGYAGNMLLAARALRLRGRHHLVRDVWFMPLYWLLASLAAWIALVDLVRRPHYWAKTPHVRNEAEQAGREKGRWRRRGRKLERVKGIEPSS